MARLKVELTVTVLCTCGRELDQVGKTGEDEITVEACPDCREEARMAGYENGYEDGKEEEKQ